MLLNRTELRGKQSTKKKCLLTDFNWYLIVVWCAAVNGSIHRVTLSAFLHPTPGVSSLPSRHRCRMWSCGGGSGVFGSSQRQLSFHFLEAGAVRFPVSLGQWGMVFVFICQLVWSVCSSGFRHFDWVLERDMKGLEGKKSAWNNYCSSALLKWLCF